MPKFCFTYAYDVPYYGDFTIEAETAEEAEKKAQEALEFSRLDCFSSHCEPCFENQDNHRVFINDDTPEELMPETTLEQIIAADQSQEVER